MGKKVLIASPVRQKENILIEFLNGILQLEKGFHQVEYLFYDDNTNENSSELLKKFADSISDHTTIWRSKADGRYQCDEDFHKWHEDLIWKVAYFKDCFIDHAVKFNYDYLFLLDSDIVLHPKTLEHLISLNKDIVAEVFWTRWSPDVMELPQVWVKDHYTLYEFNRNEKLGPEAANQRIEQFLNMLRKPGTYRVGGLGACTLISRKALTSGVSFQEIYNLSLWGEDRHFCTRAVALGFDLWADTHFPPYHIYRESELTGLAEYKESVFGTTEESKTKAK